ncbi:30S ribosomal protein S13 [Candidatus Roizmanbacteria bacterium RIFCSPHIGHO2_01_FULL_39_12b]|uniref:Small ribosomal subunit protein uS13 n=1 Tax=Candidatus Roizmanbacteria bacterium RIFCSPHIGHO2_01_FULL_39_12b TaxID=1802030 RepID=A0A1F7GC84_9BACT|nr:MAG: 30S ribosomal protein S13 [Candidatus Roizmanbacteria bacterium RIFCSPHIGHO2_01_FULL_39_12b]OGK47084.1 MAG: 30S ribosomal protein S13 [Candidatus Roizmanbacteria bacterium RIFCSPLOWO2_01_FULL_39_19]
MIRLLGVQIADNDRIEYALTGIYGIGFSRARKILNEISINPNVAADTLTENEIKKIQEYVENNIKVEGDLREETRQDIKRLKEIGSYRGLRHFHNLPVRGQRTRSNARTKRGKRKTVGALKKEDAAKMQRPTPGA